MSDTIHTTASAAAYLKENYKIDVQARTVKQWCNRGKLPGAYRVGDGLRAIWQIPQTVLDQFAANERGV